MNREPICRYRRQVLGVETTLELWNPEDFLKRIETADGQPVPPPMGTKYAGIVAPVGEGPEIDALFEVAFTEATEGEAEGIEACEILGRAAFGREVGLVLLASENIVETSRYVANAFWLTSIPGDAPEQCKKEVLVYAPNGGLVLVSR